MIPQQLANAAAHKITVTATSASLYDLLTTAASADIALKSTINGADLVVEDGDIRYLQGNTPTSAIGMLVKKGNTLRLRNVDLKTLNIIRAGAANVVVGVSVGQSDQSETTNSVASDVSLSGDVNVDNNSVDTSGYVGKASGANADFITAYASATTLTCSTLPLEVSSINADDIVSIVQIATDGSVTNTFTRDDALVTSAGTDPTTLTVGGAAFVATDTFVVYTNINRPTDAYDSGTDSLKSFEVNPLSEHHVKDPLATVTNATDGTFNYYVDMDGYKHFSLQSIISGGSGTATLKVYASNQGTTSTLATYIDVTNLLFGVASTTTSAMWLADTAIPFKFLKFEVVAATGGSNDADWTLYFKKLY